MVLAVEDDPTQRKLYDLLCKRFGFELTVADGCDQAISMIRMIKFDIIIMDWHLSGLDGLRCARAMREIQTDEGIVTPIIAVTASSMVGDRETCMDAGMDDYMSKPFQMDEFKTLVDKWTQRADQRVVDMNKWRTA